VQVSVAGTEVVLVVSVTVVGLSEHAVPPFCVRLTVPVKPFNALTVTVEVKGVLTRPEAGVAEILKSGTWTCMVAECTRSLAVAVIVTV
jgi:hypothetical protein